MFQSILVYTFLMFGMLFFAYIVSTQKVEYTTSRGKTKERSFLRLEILLPLFLFAIIFGLRYDVGVDHLHYLEDYVGRNYAQYEPAFYWISEICRSNNFHYTIYFGILAFLQVFCFFYAFKKERYLFPYLLFFLFVLGDVLSWMNIIRQSLAICVWLISIRYIVEKKLLKYIFLCIGAALFHKSAVILFVFYPLLCNGKDYFKSIKLQIVLLIGVFVLRNIFWNFFDKLEVIVSTYASLLGINQNFSYGMEVLQNDTAESSGTGLIFLFKVFLNFILVLKSNKIKKYFNSKWFNVVYFFYFVGLLTLYIFPNGVISLSRPFRYFYIFQPIMFAYFAYYLLNSKESKYGKLWCQVLMIAFLGMFYLNQITTDEFSHSWYQFYFQGE